MLSLSDPALGKVSRRGLLLRRIDIKHIKFAQRDDHGDDDDDDGDDDDDDELMMGIVRSAMIMMTMVKLLFYWEISDENGGS